jgi:hypothetical protein
LLDRDAGSDEVVYSDTLGREHVHEGRKITPLSPTDVSDRVVQAPLFVGTIVSARTVRARESQFKLLAVVRRARYRHSNVSHDHDPSTVTGQRTSQLDRVIGDRGRSENHRIAVTRTLGQVAYVKRGSIVCSRDPTLLRPLHEIVHQIDADDLATCAMQDPAGELSNQTQADYRDPFTNAGVRLTDTVKGDAADRGKRAGLEGHCVREPYAQIHRNAVQLGVYGIAAAGTRDAVPWADTGHEGTNVYDHARARVA